MQQSCCQVPTNLPSAILKLVYLLFARLFLATPQPFPITPFITSRWQNGLLLDCKKSSISCPEWGMILIIRWCKNTSSFAVHKASQHKFGCHRSQSICLQSFRICTVSAWKPYSCLLEAVCISLCVLLCKEDCCSVGRQSSVALPAILNLLSWEGFWRDEFYLQGWDSVFRHDCKFHLCMTSAPDANFSYLPLILYSTLSRFHW